MKSISTRRARRLVLCAAVLSTLGQARADVTDLLGFGVSESESAHALSAESSRTDVGSAGLPVRRLLPLQPASWEGGRVRFVMKVDPERQNYFTARFSGDDVTDDRLMLIADGKQIGWRHLGEVDQLDYGTADRAVPGRFFYNTFPLPISLTQGKSQVSFEIRSCGRLWGYGNSFEKFQKTMTEPSRGLYRVYTHTDGYFVPPADEKHGARPTDAPAATSPGPEVLDTIKARVNREIDARLKAAGPLSQTQMSLLAKAYDVSWTNAHGNPKAIEKIVQTLDALHAAFLKNPKLAHEEPSTWNPDWFGLGLCGQAIFLRQEQIKPLLDAMIDDGRGGQVSRRDAYTAMLVECRDWHRLNRRGYTNQTMLNDLNGIYLANRGIEVTDPAKALSETDAKRYLYESVGLEPWRDSDAGGTSFNFGADYWQFTDKGLTRELGYVGTYGEVIDLIADIYDATRLSPDRPGDEKIRGQLIKAAKARAAMRYSEVDADGHRVMRLEQIIGWRDSHYPGEITYGQRATRDGSALQAAAVTLDPDLVAYARQQIADGQFFKSEVYAMADTAQPLRTTIGRLGTPDQYELIRSQPPSATKLPMTDGQPDYVFTDEQVGVVAVKHGDERLYVSLYWRARNAINDLARVHHITPAFDRIAVVGQKTDFTPSGLTFTFPNWTTFAFGNGGLKYPGYDVPSAYAGLKQPIAKIPDDIRFKPGNESPYAGRGDLYTLRYGPYVIGMNMTKDRTFDLTVPTDVAAATDLVTKRSGLNPGTVLKVGPRSTVVLRVESQK